MKKSFARLTIKLAILVFGLLGFAAVKVHATAHSVDFTADTTLSGTWDAFTTLTVLSGSRATSVTVGASSVTIVVPAGNLFRLSSSSNIALSTDVGLSTNCGVTSSLDIDGSVSPTVVVTPANTACGTSNASSSQRITTTTPTGGGASCVDPKAAVITRGTGGQNTDGSYGAVIEWDNPTGSVSTNREYEVFRGAEGAASFDVMAKVEAIAGTNKRYTDATSTLRPVTYAYGLRVWETASGCARRSKDSTILNVKISSGTPVSTTLTPEPEEPTLTEPEKTEEKVEIPVVTKEKKEEPSMREKVKERKLKRTAPNPHDILSRAEFLEIVAEASLKPDIIKKHKRGRNTRSTVNRAEALKILFDAFDVETPRRVTQTSFKDVKAGTWYAPYVETANDMGLLESKAFRSRFSPSLKMKRGILDEMLQGFQQ